MAKKIVDPKIQARETAEIVEDAFRNVSNEIGKIFAKSLDQTESFAKTLQKDVTGALNSLAKTSTVIEEVLSKQKAGQLKLADIEKIKEQRAIKLKAIQLQFNIAQKNAIGGSTIQIKLAKDLEKQINEVKIAENDLNKELDVYGNKADKNNKKLGVTGALMKGLTKIPILGGLINAETVLAKIQKETAREGSTRFSVFKEGLSGVKSSIKETISDPATKITGALSIAEKIFKFLLDAMLGASKTNAAIAKSFNVSYESAKGIRNEFNALKGIAPTFIKDLPDGFTILQEELQEANFQFNRLTGQAVNLLETNKELVVQFSYYTKALGLSEEEQKALLAINAQTGASIQDTTRSILGQTSLYKKLTGYQIDERKVLRDVLSTSNLIKLSIKGGTEALIQASINAGKLGTNLEGLKSTSNALLNFEQSISDELSAELLLQRDINLDAARQAALTNDQLGLTNEIGKLVAGFGPDFQKNALAQEAFAKTLGKSKEEIADMYTNYQLIEKNRKVQQGLGEVEIKQLRDKMGLTKTQEELLRTGSLAGVEFYDILKEAGYAGKDLADKLGGLSVASLAAQSAEDKFNDAISSLKETLSNLVGSGVIDSLVNGLSALAKTFAEGGSIYTPFGESDFDKNLKKQNIDSQVKADIAIQEKIKSGEELNNVEKERAVIIGENNKLLKALNINNPNMTYSDIVGAQREFSKTEGILPVKDYVLKTLPEDTVVGAGGTKLGRTDEMVNLLKEIASANRSTPNIYLENTRLNSATAMGSYELNKGTTGSGR